MLFYVCNTGRVYDFRIILPPTRWIWTATQSIWRERLHLNRLYINILKASDLLRLVIYMWQCRCHNFIILFIFVYFTDYLVGLFIDFRSCTTYYYYCIFYNIMLLLWIIYILYEFLNKNHVFIWVTGCKIVRWRLRKRFHVDYFRSPSLLLRLFIPKQFLRILKRNYLQVDT